MTEITIIIDGDEAEVISDAEVNDLARMYIESLVDEMLMSECRGEIPVYSIERIDIRTKREALHGTADCVRELPDSWTLEDLSRDPIMMANMMDMLANDEA